jgi:hypothetical protein
LAPWGAEPGQVGRRGGEGNPEGPMSLAVGAGGDLWVLDQVNGRLQRFRRDGTFDGKHDIGPDTAQDVLALPDGRLAVLDRLGEAEILLYDQAGALQGAVPLVGGPITEGGGVTGMFADANGLYVEREHTELVRVAGPDGKPDPDRPTDPGRPTRDGTMFLAAFLADARAGTAVIRAFDRDARLVWQRQATFPAQIIHLVLLDSDQRGHAYLGALVAREGPAPDFELADAATIVVRLVQADGADAGSLRLPASDQADEVFRELVVTDEGELLQMLVTAEGVQVVRYEFP